MDGFAYFPVIVYRDERADLVEKALPVCMECLDKVRSPEQFVCQSEYLGQKTAMKEISDYLLTSSVDLLRSQGYSVEQYDFYLSGLWAQELSRGGGTNVHVHKNSQMCGWIFLESPQNGSYPIYHDSRSNKAMSELDFTQGEEISNATNAIHFNNIVPGTVLFSNSWVHHQLSGNN
jgi:hypothetical protein